MDFSAVKSITIPEGKVIEIKAGGVVIWKKPDDMKNWARFSTEADGVTIYNNGLGYKDGYRIRSGGAEGTTSSGSCTGFIPLKAGDVVRMSGYNALTNSSENAINVFDSTKTNIGQAVANATGYGIFSYEGVAYGYGWDSVTENPTGVYVWVAPPVADIAFMRVSGRTNKEGSKMIITVNQEIK